MSEPHFTVEDFKSSSMSCGVLVDIFDSIGFARALLAKGV